MPDEVGRSGLPRSNRAAVAVTPTASALQPRNEPLLVVEEGRIRMCGPVRDVLTAYENHAG